MSTLDIYELGTVPYDKALEHQENLLAKRITEEIPDSLILLEHPPTITTGRKGNTGNLLVRKEYLEKHGISFVHASRGGDITFHGPGQIVGYPILNLKNHEMDIRKHLRSIEEVIIRTLGDFEIEGRRIDGVTGVWVKRSKIASIGIAIRKWVTYHGFALNVSTNLDYFELILSCGITDVRITSIGSWLGNEESIGMDEVTQSVIKNFMGVFGFEDFTLKGEKEIN
ncbi:MAG: lipoyl(octanoyl) transferase LipB [Candidatus Dadabacteria bacterium]|nr:lipoyl(octanoyl) transferase LipB [Candidatus Dadabacteria bacterium]MYA47766.1 lipoyl(octanoyl) transferase LipB [Candidatus Dadabacteria bacterium]MYF47985.1 lipoyl(octanoyl) transferase LipB [Candidatus Dadabacteria bacterium]MYG82726.1 lipoyl(octanoyl) transferase LipB [Candidatus Dadabacteria bacterium]MYK48790.1 lipoyl(octanoyl) transferase LipB [Candidatus Dadabacteria bacterium]